MHKRSAHGELEATEESEQALYEQQLEGEGAGSGRRAAGPLGPLAAGDSLGPPPLAASAAEESPPTKRAHVTYLSEVKEESSDIPTQVAMVTEEDGAPQVALITQDGAQQVEPLGMGGAVSAWLLQSGAVGSPEVPASAAPRLLLAFMDSRELRLRGPVWSPAPPGLVSSETDVLI